LIFFCSVISVFNVTDQDGNKVIDEVILDYIRKVSVSHLVFFELLCSLLMYKTANIVHCLIDAVYVFSLLVRNLAFRLL
jgi:hypothetical protein